MGGWGGGGHSPRHTNDGAPRTRKRHQQEHRPQRPTERSDPTQHAKGRTGDFPGPRKETTTRRNVTLGRLGVWGKVEIWESMGLCSGGCGGVGCGVYGGEGGVDVGCVAGLCLRTPISSSFFVTDSLWGQPPRATNRQLPPTANRQQPPSTNCQPRPTASQPPTATNRWKTGSPASNPQGGETIGESVLRD